MQMLIEGIAMGSFATLNVKTNDPVLRQLVRLVMSDEAFHHRFGRIWAAKTIRFLSEDEHKKVEDWSAQLFQMLLFNLINTEQKQVIYAKYGLDWEWVRDAVRETFGDEEHRAQLTEEQRGDLSFAVDSELWPTLFEDKRQAALDYFIVSDPPSVHTPGAPPVVIRAHHQSWCWPTTATCTQHRGLRLASSAGQPHTSSSCTLRHHRQPTHRVPRGMGALPEPSHSCNPSQSDAHHRAMGASHFGSPRQRGSPPRYGGIAFWQPKLEPRSPLRGHLFLCRSKKQ
jgi:hypothetical protein